MIKTVSCYFPGQTDWFGLMIENQRVYCAVGNKLYVLFRFD